MWGLEGFPTFVFLAFRPIVSSSRCEMCIVHRVAVLQQGATAAICFSCRCDVGVHVLNWFERSVAAARVHHTPNLKKTKESHARPFSS